jgi:hypothetical protein
MIELKMSVKKAQKMDLQKVSQKSPMRVCLEAAGRGVKMALPKDLKMALMVAQRKDLRTALKMDLQKVGQKVEELGEGNKEGRIEGA